MCTTGYACPLLCSKSRAIPSCRRSPHSFLLAYGVKIKQVTVVNEHWKILEGTYDLYPAQRHDPLGELPVFTHKDDAVYASDAPYPSGVQAWSGRVVNGQIKLRVEPSITRYAATIWVDRAGTVHQHTLDDNTDDILLSIYDVIGRCVKTIRCDSRQSTQRVVWHGDNSHGREVAAGIYFVRVEREHHTACKLILLR